MNKIFDTYKKKQKEKTAEENKEKDKRKAEIQKQDDEDMKMKTLLKGLKKSNKAIIANLKKGI